LRPCSMAVSRIFLGVSGMLLNMPVWQRPDTRQRRRDRPVAGSGRAPVPPGGRPI
jgi:hypothetical protein